MYFKQLFTFHHVTKVIAMHKSFQKVTGSLTETYLYKFVQKISRVPIQCNMAEIQLNRIPYNLKNKFMDIIPFSVGKREGKAGG